MAETRLAGQSHPERKGTGGLLTVDLFLWNFNYYSDIILWCIVYYFVVDLLFHHPRMSQHNYYYYEMNMSQHNIIMR